MSSRRRVVECSDAQGSALAEFSKDMGKLPPEESASVGKLLNAAKQHLEAALDARKAPFADAALQRAPRAEWVDLTLPAPGSAPAPASAHTDPAEIEDLFTSLGFAVLDGPRSRPSTTTSTR